MTKRLLTVGLDYAAPVPLHTDYNSGTFVGFEVDIINALAGELNALLNFHISYWKDIVSDLRQGKSDLVCSAATVSEDKQKIVTFSKPYLDFHLCTVVNNVKPFSISALKRKTIGVREDSEAKYLLLREFPEATLVISDTNDELYGKLKNMEVDALVDDSPIAYGFTSKDAQLSIGELIPGTGSSYAIMLRHGNEDLKQDINTILEKLEREGTLQQLKKKWFNDAQL